jgi:iron(III) transport system substrate-binding protein
MTTGARSVDGHTQLAELLAAGEFAVAATGFNHSMDDQTDAGAPVRWRPAVEPVVVKAAGVGVLRGAPHPAAAALFYEWILTEGQRLLEEDHRIPSVLGGEDPLAGIDVIEVDPDLIAEKGEEWSRRYRELLR